MKKNLLTLSLVVASMTAYAQQNTYIGTKAVVKVQPNTLFYNGGDLKMVDNRETRTTPVNNYIVKNNGNIQVEGDFENSLDPTNNTNNIKGKTFINEWKGEKDYGQLIIKDTKNSRGKVAMERKTPKVEGIDEYIIALPFKGESAEDVFTSITNYGAITSPEFNGECEVNVKCLLRYQQSMFVWDNLETEYDPVQEGTNIDPIKRYLLNTRNGSALKNYIQNVNTPAISLAGTPANESYSIDLKSSIVGKTYAQFSEMPYGNIVENNATIQGWKNLKNNYSETYDSYIGNQTSGNDANRLFGKNLHRISNPFTSNIDLSDLSTANTWIKFNLRSTSGYSSVPTAVYSNAIRFRVFKNANDFKITWTGENGNHSTAESNTSFSAYIRPSSEAGKYFWTGSPEALLVKPYETFYIDYYAINTNNTTGNGSRIIDANVTLGDKQKTFNTEYLPITNPETGQINGTFSRNNSNSKLRELQSDENLKARGLVTDFDFTQLELYLSENNSIKGSAAYLLNANFMTTGNSTSNKTANNSVYFYEETNEGQVAVNAETTANEFNSEDYIGKPLRVGFKNLVEGNVYQMNLNLYEYSILNKVDNLSLGRYYLLDKQTNSITEVDATTQIRFTANQNSNNRFEFYWNEEPRTLTTIDVNKNATYIYKDKQDQFVRFEDKNITATVEIFDITGRSIHKADKVSTSIDYKLNLSNVPTVYVVVITYDNGKVVTKKTINKF